MPAVVLYSCLFGNYDELPLDPGQGCPSYLFTDCATLKAPGWQIVHLPLPLPFRRASRAPKLRPHDFLPAHEISVYMDANLRWKRSALGDLLTSLGSHDIAAFAHPNPTSLAHGQPQKRTVRIEAQKIVEFGLDNPGVVAAQLASYEAANFPDKEPLTENCLLIRRDTRGIRTLADLWWKEYESGSQRDQMSLQYCCWTLNVALKIIPGNPRDNDMFCRTNHLGNRQVHQEPDNTPVVVKTMRGTGKNLTGLRQLISTLPANLRGIEIGSYAGESTREFAASGKFKSLVCVDPWATGHFAKAEAEFDKVLREFPSILSKHKDYSHEAVKCYQDSSVDFVYIDANHRYIHVLRDIVQWLPKISVGGIIAGHDYGQEREDLVGVKIAVDEVFGKPDKTFEDHSWLVTVAPRDLEIVTYCTAAYAPCLDMTLQAMLDFGMPDRLVIYTDEPSAMQRFTETSSRVIVRSCEPIAGAARSAHWRMKIAILEKAHRQSTCRFMVWFDADVMPVAPFLDVKKLLENADIGATRMFCSSRSMDANAGVIFFHRRPEPSSEPSSGLSSFFADWAVLSDHYEKTGEAGEWFEQHAFSVLAHDAVAGHRSYKCIALPEDIYNLEDDHPEEWLRRIAAHHPKILHLKNGWWKNTELVSRALRIGKDPSTFHAPLTVVTKISLNPWQQAVQRAKAGRA